MQVIVSEKDSAAKRIAAILSDDAASQRSRSGVSVYAWDQTRVIGLSGHIVGIDFPSEYDNWSSTDPVELIDAEVIKQPTSAAHVKTLERLARKADHVVIATDYDREGELIAKEAFDIVREVDQAIPINRVRFSSLTKNEIESAFADPDDVDFALAAAGEARRIIDLLWGAALTRFLSLAARQFGDDFISVGRVQSPALKVLVDREREIEAFEPEDYWEILAELRQDPTAEGFQAQYYYLDLDDSETNRIWSEHEAKAVESALNGTATASVTDVTSRTRTDRPPAPFNTTQFIRAAGAIGFAAKPAMSIAETLYTAGYISYPRTDNTVYPHDLNIRALISTFAETPEFGDDARSLLGQDSLTPTRGKKQTTDHPPIHPTGRLPRRGGLSNAEWRIYELIVRRFFATVAPPATWAHQRIVASAAGLALKTKGKRLVNPGYHAVYPYFKTEETHVPEVEENEELVLAETTLLEKQTEPPRRYGQSRLIETMEEMGIGTKSTRHTIVEKLYDRGYVEGNPPVPTQLARGVVEAAEQHAEHVVSETMTAQLEEDMTAIAEGETTLEAVTAASREMLQRVFDDLEPSKEDIGAQIRDALKRDKFLGPCPESTHQLLVRRSRAGSYFVGCDGYPDCEYTLPLPNTGRPHILDAVCTTHDLHHVKMLAGQRTFTHGCPQCRVESAEETNDRVIGDCPACDAGALAIKTLRTGSRLAGCTRYPDCEYSLPLPRRGELTVTDQQCDTHELPELVVENGSEPWELGCPICNYRAYQARTENHDGALETITGIGEKTAEKLSSAGIEDVEDLKAADPEEVAGLVDGVSAGQIKDWKARA